MTEQNLNNDPLKSSSPEFDLTPEHLIAAGISGIIERNIKNVGNFPFEQVQVLNSQTAECLRALLGNKDQINQVSRQVMELKLLYSVLEMALKENTVLNQQYFNDHILEPMVQALLPINDLIEDTIVGGSETTAAIDPPMRQLLDAVRMQLMQFLCLYGIDYIRHEPGVHFEPQVMKPVTITETTVPELEGKIAKSLQAGFRLNGRRLLRPESVVIYRFVRHESL